MGTQISGRNPNYVPLPGWKTNGVFMRKRKGNNYISKDISTGASTLFSYTCWLLSLKNVRNHRSLWSGYLLFCWFIPAQKLFCPVPMSQRWNDYFGCISVSHTSSGSWRSVKLNDINQIDLVCSPVFTNFFDFMLKTLLSSSIMCCALNSFLKIISSQEILSQFIPSDQGPPSI